MSPAPVLRRWTGSAAVCVLVCALLGGCAAVAPTPEPSAATPAAAKPAPSEAGPTAKPAPLPNPPAPAAAPPAVAAAPEAPADFVGDLREIARGIASWYGKRFHGRRTANGERFDMNGMTAAHRTLPFGTRVRVRSVDSGREVDVRINDRGPHLAGRIIDLSRAAALALGLHEDGLEEVVLFVATDAAVPAQVESPDAAPARAAAKAKPKKRRPAPAAPAAKPRD